MYNFKNKKEQIEALTDFINECAEFRINNENGKDWEEYQRMGYSEVEDQLTGISNFTVNGKLVECAYSALAEGLTEQDLKAVERGLKYSTLRDGWQYIFEGL